RKAPYQYGWDWGPRFVTSGIWKPVYLRSWDNARIADVQVVQKSLLENLATLTANLEILSVKNQECTLKINDIVNDTILADNTISLQKGKNNVTVNFEIPKPLLWWPNGMGDQSLYSLDFIIQASGTSDTISENIGLRTIERVQNKDSVGESFYFTVNGIPVFMKGANYIPQDNFPSRVTDERYQAVIRSAVDANMNMLRVWGGGIYENDIFYDLCDEYGILVWQDFMFACTMYPGDSAFLENVREEAVQNVKRLRNHACLALWCGNNEIDEGWHNWGWQKAMNYSASDSTEVWNNYLEIFENILHGAVSLYSPYTPYTPSSPRIGWGHEEAMTEGDMHYWGVWWGEQPFEVYEEKVGRFMSEYGFQGFPDIVTLDSCLNAEDLNLGSKALLNHQKHPRGMELINTYMSREYEVPNSFEDYCYVSQLVQAYGIRKAIEAHRRAMPVCMGTLYWQLNDCWPVISWSSTDYYHRWKALHYFVKEAFQDLLVSFDQKKDFVRVFVVSDKPEDLSARLTIRVLDFNGNVKWKSEDNIQVTARTSKKYSELNTQGYSKNHDLLVAGLYLVDSLIAENILYFGSPKELNLPAPEISKEITTGDYGYLIHLKSDKLAKNVFLKSDADALFSPNYFDIVPGSEKIVKCFTSASREEFERNLKIIHLQSVYP
ncbi:MAG: glycoside hydrolase family 2 protein, partial [Bacteroidetes bacterium]|nr:glycoside hydrolase family 2 protein [Bacteroidota bacterium]